MSVAAALLIAVAIPSSGAIKASQSAPAELTPVAAGKVSTTNPRSIVAALQKEGYRAKLITDDGDRPYIESAAEGATFYIYLQNCKERRECQDVMFRASYDKRVDDPVRIDAINEYNREKRWARAYLDKDGSPVVEYDVLFTDQMIDEKMFAEALGIWSTVLSDFHDAIGW